jgi:TolB-like protein
MKQLFVLLYLTSIPLLGQKPKSYQVVTGGLIEKIISSPTPKAPVNLAVVPFTATVSSVQNSKAFGEYLTETIIGSLSGHPEKLKLFERTRMDAILKEHEFILTDLMKPAAALKIGQLAPIDALLSGTYTKLKSYVDVSARLMDVTSGEIMASYTGRIKMNKNLAMLFQQNETSNNAGGSAVSNNSPPVTVTVNNTVNTGTTTAKTKEEICKEKVNEFKPLLHDLSTTEKINTVAQEAMKTPFDNLCGRLHYDVMNYFTRYKIDHPAYHRFLLSTLDSIAYPAGDDRAIEIIRYAASDGRIDEQEWNSGLSCMARTGNYWLSNYVNYLLAKPTAENQATSEARIKAYFSLASSEKLGLPRPISYEMAFIEMMEGLKSNQPLRQHVYEIYALRLTLDDKTKATIFSELSAMYKEETSPQRKTELIGWLADFVNAYEYPKAHEQLYDFAWNFKLSPYEQYNAEKRKEYPEPDLKLLTAKSRDKFSRYATLSPYTSQAEDRINFCVTYQIPVPGVIPTLAEAETILKGTHLDEQLKVMKLLVLMNDQPKIIEASIVSLFSKRSLEDRGKMEEIQTLAIQVLGNTKTSDKKAIDFMLSVLPHYGNDTEAAKETLVKIGKPAVGALAARLDKTTDQDGGLQFQLITILGKMGKAAQSAEKSIQRVLALTRNSDVKYAAEAALQEIK